MFLVGGMQDEQLGSHWMQMIPAFDDDDDVWITAYNGLHNDALQPAILTRWVEFIELFVADEVPVIPAGGPGVLGRPVRREQRGAGASRARRAGSPR